MTPASRLAATTNAGHDPPCVRGVDGSLQRLEERHGPLAGVAPGVVYGESRRRLAPGAVVVAFTDGVTQARRRDEDLRRQRPVKQVMELSGMSSLLHLYDTEKDALAAFA